MVPLVVLVVATLVTRLVGVVWTAVPDGWEGALRVGLAVMLLLAASAHVGSRRADLVRMVPPSLPAREHLVSVTGVLEVAIAVGLLVEATAAWAAASLAVLLVAMFPANVHAARAGVGIGGRPPTPLVPRTAMQLAFVTAALTVVVL